MLDIAETLDPLLDARARHVEQAELGLEDEDIDEYTAETTLQLIFFDGEDSFMAWTATAPSTVHSKSLLSLPPPPLIRFPHFSFSHTDTSPKSGGRRTCPHI
jgi:hypothetical protein